MYSPSACHETILVCILDDSLVGPVWTCGLKFSILPTPAFVVNFFLGMQKPGWFIRSFYVLPVYFLLHEYPFRFHVQKFCCVVYLLLIFDYTTEACISFRLNVFDLIRSAVTLPKARVLTIQRDAFTEVLLPTYEYQ